MTNALNINDDILEHPERYAMKGIVVHGKGLGKKVGMPTANLDTAGIGPLPPHGVYASEVKVNGAKYIGVTNVGLRPSVDDSPIPTIETLILDFDKDIYDKEIAVTLKRYLRPIQTFNGLSEVKAQVDKDKQEAVKLLS